MNVILPFAAHDVAPNEQGDQPIQRLQASPEQDTRVPDRVRYGAEENLTEV
jgi:hypothetical protein